MINVVAAEALACIKYDKWCGCRTLDSGHWTLDTGHWTQACRVPMAAVHGLMARQKKKALAPPISLASVLPPSRPLLFLASPFPRPSCLRPLPSRIPTSYPDPLPFPAFLSPLLRQPPGTSDLLRVLICYEWRCGFILLLLWFYIFDKL